MSNNETTQLDCKPAKGKKGNLLVCSLNISSQAGKHISDPVRLLLKGAYGKERPQLHKLLDTIGILILAATIAGLVYLLIPKSVPDLLIVDATVAPSQVITGGASTLTFRYENNSDQTLENVRLRFDFPAHFALDAIDSDDGVEEIAFQEFDLGDIAPTQYGNLHVKGTMFGDVGGEQLFTTTLEYSYEENDNEVRDTKTVEHIFSPTASTLALTLNLPDHLVARQEVEGTIEYTNTGDVTFPDMTIEPLWPDTFTLLSSSPALQSTNRFRVNGIDPGDTGVIEFVGILGTQDDSTFTFAPSFAFDDTRYQQDVLQDTIDILPPPVSVSHSLSENTLIPGDTATIDVRYENTSDYTIENLAVRISSDTAVFGSNIEGGTLEGGYYLLDDVETTLEPGESGSGSITLPVRSTLSRSQVSTYENINVTTQASATFTFQPNGEVVDSNTFGTDVSTPLSSPATLETFGRYWMPSGDQVGRGPVPPLVGETTKYWVFWNVSGTTNTLSNVQLSAELGPGVSLTGRQSASQGGSVTSQNGTVIWNLGSLEPTLPPTSTVVGVAFEVAITPTAAQVGTTPTLLGVTRMTAQDTRTGAFLSKSDGVITTVLPYDSKASAYGGVVEE